MTRRQLPDPRTNNVWYYRSAGNADTVVVFVHGIFSDSRSCWLRSETPRQYWPTLIRSDRRFGDAAIYLGGFFTQVDAGDYDVADCAQELLTALKRPSDDGSPSLMSTFRRLFFICHSTGGIVVRYMLERWATDFDGHPVGVALIASPSLGSAWADLADQLARFYKQRLALQLGSGNDNLTDLDERFRDLVRRRTPALLQGGEAHENRFILHAQWWPRIRRVVEPHSAGRGYWGSPVNLAGTDHFTAVKPSKASDPPHTFVVDVWTSFLESSGGGAGLGTWTPSEPPPELIAPSSTPPTTSRFVATWPTFAVAVAVAAGVGSYYAWDAFSRRHVEPTSHPSRDGSTFDRVSGGGLRLTPEQLRLLEELIRRNPSQFRQEADVVTTFWPIGSVVNVAFVGGTDRLRSEVMAAVDNWIRGASIHFAFVDDVADSEVRISFEGHAETGTWSYLGTQALAVPRTDPTTILDVASYSDTDREQAIHHEVGHILGLTHEHQNPAATALLNWPVVYSELTGPPNYWPQAAVDDNLRPAKPDSIPAIYRVKVFDPTSVMLYSFPRKWLNMPIQPGTRPSAADLALVQAVYR